LEFTSKAPKPSGLCTYVEFIYALDGDIGKDRPSLRILAPFPKGMLVVLTVKVIRIGLVAYSGDRVVKNKEIKNK
jgi:hypothetical protein